MIITFFRVSCTAQNSCRSTYISVNEGSKPRADHYWMTAAVIPLSDGVRAARTAM